MVELNTVIFDVLYLLAAILFIMGIKKMGHPRTAVTGNLLGGGMLLVLAPIFDTLKRIDSKQFNAAYRDDCCAIFIGTLFGMVLAIRVQMTEMPCYRRV